MILLDTHIWVWLADENDRLMDQHRRMIEDHRAKSLYGNHIKLIVRRKMMNTEAN